MNFKLKSRDKRALGGLILAAVVYLLLAYVALPTYDWIKGGGETVAQKEDELKRYRRALANREHYIQLLDQAKKSVAEGEARLVRGDNPSLASVEFPSPISAKSARQIVV